jgi:SAM-dependent methyltransferase
MLTPEQKWISDDFMHHWHEVLPKRYGIVDEFNHKYPVRHAPQQFSRTLEIGAGLGEHLLYERLKPGQKSQYVALELRQNMAIQTSVGDCQARLAFEDGYFDRVLAIHVLEHLPNLPAAVAEMFRICNKESGIFSVVIPCEGSLAYTMARRISAQRIFEKRYKQSYRWLIEREHLNRPEEILPELDKFFAIEHRAFFPFGLPMIWCNLCIGLTLRPQRGSRSVETTEMGQTAGNNKAFKSTI